MRGLTRKSTWLPLAAVALLGACEAENHFARVYRIERMADTIGGPAAAARPGDYMLENDQVRAVIHGRHNQRGTFPISNGSLMDLDLQRPHHRYGVGKGKDAFYELGPMVNLRVSTSTSLAQGPCDEVGDAPCPAGIEGCARVTTTGKGDDILGVLALLDLAINRDVEGKKVYDSDKLQLTTDYDLCPGERFVRVTTTVRFDDEPDPSVVEMDELKGSTGLLEVFLGEHTGQDCAKDPCPAGTGQKCDDLLVPLAASGFSMEMKRCRLPEHKLGGVLAGDYTFFSGKVNVFIPGAGFDHESYVRSVFDTGGDIFSKPLAMSAVAAVADDVSYAYFNQGGQVMIPVFAEAFTASMSNRYACKRSEPECLRGKKLRFHRFVSVGQGDVASALYGLYQVQNTPFGELEGHVVDGWKREPLSGVDVFAHKVPAAWEKLTDGEIGQRSYKELVAQHKRETATKDDPEGNEGIISHFKSDVGMDFVADGSFSGPLPVSGPVSISCPSPECRYVLVARSRERAPSGLYVVWVRQNQITRATIAAGPSSTLQFDVQDISGRPLPCKLTIGHCFPECARDRDCQQGQVCDEASRLCRPKAGYQGPESCRPDQQWVAGAQTCACRTEGLLPLSHGGRRYADGTVHTLQTASGKGQVELAPGVYQVIVSRGFEYEISRQLVTLLPGRIARLKAVLPRSVDTQGWVSADLHVHGPNSVDSGLDHDTRVRSYAGEGVEFFAATDHDNLTDYAPAIFKLGLQAWIKTDTGVEVSPIDYGHFVGFPLRFDENAELNGAFHWRVDDPGGSPNDWQNLTPGAIFRKLRELGALGAERTLVFVAHFYDHFTFYNLDPITMEAKFSFTTLFNKVLLPINFSGAFDALEAFNGKNLDIVRRPTYGEVRDYNAKLEQAIQASKQASYDERQRALGRVAADAQRDFLERTPEEQKLAISYINPNFECRCTADAECGAGALCALDTGTCITSCTSDAHCDATLVAAGREACQQLGSDPGRKTCQRLAATCTTSDDCPVEWTSKKTKETCVKGQCELTCTEDEDCVDAKRPVCDTQGNICVPPPAAQMAIPCSILRGTLDDYFQLLNHGVYRPILGNSDSHDTYGTEAGLPRNYVRSATDLPHGIRTEEIAGEVKAMHSFPSYGPFVEVTLNGEPMGATVKVKQGQAVKLKLRVQSPLWFDVDRIEVYSNGDLIKVIEGSESCDPKSGTCIRVPNDKAVNFDGTIDHTPTQDAWYVVAVMGLDGKSMAPVYSSTPVARLGIFELIQRLTPLLPPLRSLRTPLSPSMTLVRPYAVTNPIFVDVGGDGMTPLHAPPVWAQQGAQSSALTQAPPPAHDHSAGLGRMRVDAANLRQLVADGVITLPAIQQAIDQLRFYSFRP
jgi:hypothetical protein